MLWLFVVGVVFMFFLVIQDIVVDGMVVSVLQLFECGVVNGVQVGGYYFGQIVGGGFVLFLYLFFGWMLVVFFMVFLFGVVMILVWSYFELEWLVDVLYECIDFGVLKCFFVRFGVWFWVFVFVFFCVGEVMVLMMFNLLFVDCGLLFDQIGLVFGVVSFFGLLVGVFFGGLFLQCFG